MTLAELSVWLGCSFEGDPQYLVEGLASLERASAHQLSFLGQSKYLKHLKQSKAGVVLLHSSHKAYACTANCLLSTDPELDFNKLLTYFHPPKTYEAGVHATVQLGQNCCIHPSVTILAGAVIGDGVSIGAHVVIHPRCVIGDNVRIGELSVLYPGVICYEGVSMGARAIIHSGVVLGSDGFGYLSRKNKWLKVPQIGSVSIGDDVDIGANTTIDRGALHDTVIGHGVKLDNQIQVGHNVTIGDYTAIAGCTAIAGSVTIGRCCRIGGGVAIAGHLQIVDGVVLTGRATVVSSILKPGVYSSLLPVQIHREWMRSIVNILRINKLLERVKKLEVALNGS